ncbi:MAG: hypothetical protein SXA11_12210 [Cyanobacteriota bacterium]|nr:hypothetical protein [Cyanobacteriota bacterium]
MRDSDELKERNKSFLERWNVGRKNQFSLASGASIAIAPGQTRKNARSQICI